ARARALERHRRARRPPPRCSERAHPEQSGQQRVHDRGRDTRNRGRQDALYRPGTSLDESRTRSAGRMDIPAVNLVFSSLVFYVAARIYLWPKLPELEPRTVLVPILLLHAMRHLGLMFLSPGATYPGMPPQFAYPAAYGDLVAALLALASIAA